MMSRGFVIIVVVKPPKEPAMHWISRCETFEGRSFMSSSVGGEEEGLRSLTEIEGDHTPELNKP
jgi:hypothetical protein